MSTDADAITDELVAGIADRMVEEGRKVSPVTIWPEVHSGSIVAIAAALQRWREARQPKAPQLQREAGLPENMAETLVSAAGRLWTAAQEEAERAVSERLGVVNQHLGAVLAERDEALAEYQKTVEEVETGRERLIAQTNALNASESAAMRLAAELATATGRAEAAETRIEELVQRASLEDAKLEQTKAALDEERRAREALATVVSSKSDEIARITQQRDEARQEVATATSRAEAAETRIGELVQRASLEDAKLEDTKAALDEERRAREALSAVVSGKSDEIARITQERDEARQEAATLGDACQAKSDEVTRWSQESSAASARAEAATAQANERLARIAALEAELDEARTALAAERQTGAARIDEAAVQLNELQRVARELEEAREQVGAMAEAKTAATAELARVAQDASAARERADAAEQHAAQLEQRLAAFNEAAAKDMQRGQQPGIQAGDPAQANEVAALQHQLSAQAKAHAKALGDLRTNAEQWVAHARELKQRLGLASERILFVDARSTGEVALVRRLSSELERLKPDHELISREVQQKLIVATLDQQLARKGYRYDPATAVMSKIES